MLINKMMQPIGFIYAKWFSLNYNCVTNHVTGNCLLIKNTLELWRAVAHKKRKCLFFSFLFLNRSLSPNLFTCSGRLEKPCSLDIEGKNNSFL